MKRPEGWPETGPLKLETYARTFVEVAFKPNAAKDFEGKLTISPTPPTVTRASSRSRARASRRSRCHGGCWEAAER